MSDERGTGSRIAAITQKVGASPQGVWLIGSVVSPTQRAVYRLSRGWLSLTGRAPVLLLTTRGRRTRIPRTVPAFYRRDGGRYVVCNVRPPGERTHPWVLNIRAEPRVILEVGGQRIRGRARAASEEEPGRYWPDLVQIWPAYKRFHLAGGERSVFVVEPEGEMG